MEEPKYTINTFIENLNVVKSGWIFQDIYDYENYYGGEAFKVLESNQPIPQLEVKGKIRGNKFFSRYGNYEALIEVEFHNVEALAIKAIDGVVIVQKESVNYRDGMRIEGYWHSSYTPQYKKPKPNQLSESEAESIFKLIKEKEKECKKEGFRGYSQSRFDNSQVGSHEYYHENWLWPEGFAEHYVLKYKVKPSDAFLVFIGWNPEKP
ncbi:MAG: hypothetical protein AB8G11_17030 [Saprospiraceae bacterium]